MSRKSKFETPSFILSCSVRRTSVLSSRVWFFLDFGDVTFELLDQQKSQVFTFLKSDPKHNLLQISLTQRGSRWGVILIWTLNISVLFLGDYSRGFKSTSNSLAKFFGFVKIQNIPLELINFGKKFKRGVISWQTYFRMTFLRHISFALDHYWACRNRPSRDLKGESLPEKHTLNSLKTTHFFQQISLITTLLKNLIYPLNNIPSQTTLPTFITYPYT